MRLLGTEAFRTSLSEGLLEAKQEIIVLSAFVTLNGYSWLLEKIQSEDVVGKLVVRWRPDDLLIGASDLGVYEFAKQKGWSIFVCPELHAKSVLIDGVKVFVGSANITGRGLSIVPGANRELGICFSPTQQDLAVFDNVLSESTLVTDALFKKIEEFLLKQPKAVKSHKELSWPEEIEKIFKKPPEKLWVADLMWTSPEKLLNIELLDGENKRNALHDFRLLGVDDIPPFDLSCLKEAFIVSRCWQWLSNVISKNENREIYFGEASFLLHNSLLDDPRPYRKNVKELVQNLYLWVKFISKEYIKVDIPGNKSQRIKFINKDL